MNRYYRSLTLVAMCLMLLSMRSISVQASEPTGELRLSVVVVYELTPKPVPLTDFKITADFGDHASQVTRTDEHGEIDLKLPPGKYVIENIKPVTYKGRSYRWQLNVSIDADKVCQLKVTDADSVQLSEPPARQVSDEAQIYQQLKNGVLSVESELGQGSGFVVDKSGLVLTNQHVVNGSHWFALKWDHGARIRATVLAQDKDADIAVLRFNPDAVQSMTVLPLADPSVGPLAVEGEKVLAIGNPLHQTDILSTGIVSKVDGDVMISDVNINHGNSGGPLINLAGQVIGMTTFLDPGTPDGPGISGIISINKALPVLAEARKAAATAEMPSAEMLPVVSPVPIPSDQLKAAARRNLSPYEIRAPHNFLTQIYTPFIRESQDRAMDREFAKARRHRVRKRGKNAVTDDYDFGHYSFWERFNLHTTDAVVTIQVVPVPRETSGSLLAGVFSALGRFRSHHKLEFRDDFYDMELYRGNTLIEPVRRSRQQASVFYEDMDVEMIDQAYGGLYAYDPSVFEPGMPLVLKVRREANLDRWDEVHIDRSDQKRIWDEFAAYRAAALSASFSSSY